MAYVKLYRREDFLLIGTVRAGCDYRKRQARTGNYESHHLCTATWYTSDFSLRGHHHLNSLTVKAELLTARYVYAARVLEAALAKTTELYPDWLAHTRTLQQPGWLRLGFSSPQRREAEDCCARLVRDIANRGEIKVREHFQVELEEKCQRIRGILNFPALGKQVVDAIEKGQTLPISQAELSFSYAEIAPHIVRLDEHLLALLNSGESTPPLTNADQDLLVAAQHLDLMRMRQAVEGGANVNALFDEESMLCHVVQAHAWDHLPANRDYDHIAENMPDYPLAHRCEVIDWLLQQGADINLFGVDGLAPLSAAVLAHDPDLVRYLLRQGADPASNQFPDEPPWDEPTAKYYADGDLYVVDEGSREYIDVWEINVLLDTALLEQHLAQGRSLSGALVGQTPEHCWMCCTNAAYLMALVWNRLDVALLSPHLAEGIIYESPRAVSGALLGKPAVLAYLQTRLQALREHGPINQVRAQLGVTREGPCVVLSAENDPEMPVAILNPRTEAGMITRLTECNVASASIGVRTIGISPR